MASKIKKYWWVFAIIILIVIAMVSIIVWVSFVKQGILGTSLIGLSIEIISDPVQEVNYGIGFKYNPIPRCRETFASSQHSIYDALSTQELHVFRVAEYSEGMIFGTYIVEDIQLNDLKATVDCVKEGGIHARDITDIEQDITATCTVTKYQEDPPGNILNVKIYCILDGMIYTKENGEPIKTTPWGLNAWHSFVLRVPKEGYEPITVYRLQENQCIETVIYPGEELPSDYDTLSECESQTVNVYRFEENRCKFLSILQSEVTNLDYCTLDECQSQVIVGEVDFYRLEDNECVQVSISPSDATDLDYSTLEECEANIKTEEELLCEQTGGDWVEQSAGTCGCPTGSIFDLVDGCIAVEQECSVDADCPQDTCLGYECSEGDCIPRTEILEQPCEEAVWVDYPTCEWDISGCEEEPKVNYLLYLVIGIIVIFFIIIITLIIRKIAKG